MIRGPLAHKDYRGRFAGHETFPLRHLWLRKAYDQVTQTRDGAPRSLFTDAESIVTFGVGKNMAAAIRHWALACDIVQEAGNRIQATELGHFLFSPTSGRDPCMESPATTWLIHWMVAGSAPPKRTTTWFYAFHNFTAHTFDRKSLSMAIQDFQKSQDDWPKASEATIKRDVECFVRSYAAQPGSKFIDDSTVLTELGLIQTVDTRSFQFRRGPKPGLPYGVFLFALHEFWQNHAPDQNTLSVESIIYEPGSPGRAFKLDELSLTERLAQVDEASDGIYRWSASAGVRNVARHNAEINKFNLLDLAYSASTCGKAA